MSRDTDWMPDLLRDVQRALYTAAQEAAAKNDPRAPRLRKLALRADDMVKEGVA